MLARRVASALIRTYRLTFSAVLGRQCRFLPTCSDYADEAIRRHGLWLGGWMGAARICRCRPGARWGYDPVPRTLAADATWARPWRALAGVKSQERASNCADSA